MIKTFFWLSLLALVQGVLFKTQGGLEFYQQNLSMLPLWSFGNMGFQENICVKLPISLKQLTYNRLDITCQDTTKIAKVVDSGLIMSKGLPIPSASDKSLQAVDRIISTCELTPEQRTDS